MFSYLTSKIDHLCTLQYFNASLYSLFLIASLALFSEDLISLAESLLAAIFVFFF